MFNFYILVFPRSNKSYMYKFIALIIVWNPSNLFLNKLKAVAWSYFPWVKNMPDILYKIFCPLDTKVFYQFFLLCIYVCCKTLRCFTGRLVIFIFENVSLLSSVADPDPFGSVSFWSAGSGSGSASMKRIRVAKNRTKSLEYHTFFSKLLNLCLLT